MKSEAKLKLQHEADEINQPMARMLARQVTDMLVSEQRAGVVLQEGKTLKECKAALDQFAKEHKQGNESVIDPETAEQLISTYYGFGQAARKESSGIIDISDLL